MFHVHVHNLIIQHRCVYYQCMALKLCYVYGLLLFVGLQASNMQLYNQVCLLHHALHMHLKYQTEYICQTELKRELFVEANLFIFVQLH